MKTFLIILCVIAVAIFTGSWIFDIFAWAFGALQWICSFMAKVFNIFGWNNGIIAGASTLLIGGIL